MSGDASYLRHILDAIERIERYTSVGRERFFAETHWQDATIRQLVVVGEAVKRLSGATRDRMPSVPWKDIAGMRDFLIHTSIPSGAPVRPTCPRSVVRSKICSSRVEGPLTRAIRALVPAQPAGAA